MTRRARTPRSRGERAGLDLPTILKAARAIAPDDLTMKAVAHKLGVDPKALNYYVADREYLLELVAGDVFASNFGTVDIAEDSDWQDACRTFGEAYADSLIKMGMLVEHFRFGSSISVGFLQPGEMVLEKLIAAGFDDQTASCLLLMLTKLSVGYAQHYVSAARTDRALMRGVRSVLTQLDDPKLKTLSRVVTTGVPIDERRQLTLSIDVFLHGVTKLLEGGERQPPSKNFSTKTLETLPLGVSGKESTKSQRRGTLK